MHGHCTSSHEITSSHDLSSRMGFHFKSRRFHTTTRGLFCFCFLDGQRQYNDKDTGAAERHKKGGAAHRAALGSRAILYKGWSACCEAPAFKFATLQVPCRGFGRGSCGMLLRSSPRQQRWCSPMRNTSVAVAAKTANGHYCCTAVVAIALLVKLLL